MMSLFPLGAGHIETSEMRSRSKVNIKHLRQHWFFKKDLRKLKSSLCFLPFLHSLKPNLPSYEQMEGLTVDKLFNGGWNSRDLWLYCRTVPATRPRENAVIF